MRVFIFLLLLCSFFSAASQKQLLVVTELAPPHQVLNDGEVTGAGTEFIRQVFEAANYTANIHIYPWARAFMVASKVKNTFIYSIARTPEREKQFIWIGEPIGYFELGFIALSSRQDIKVTKTEDAKSYKIAMQRHDYATKILTSLGFEVVLTSDIKQSYALLIAKKVDLIVDDPAFMLQMAEYLKLEKNFLSVIHIVDELKVHSYLAANLGTAPQYIDALNKAFFEVTKHTPSPYIQAP